MKVIFCHFGDFLPNVVTLFFCLAGSLLVLSNKNKNFSERYVFLLDGMIIICKQNKQHKPTSFNLREKFLIRRGEFFSYLCK